MSIRQVMSHVLEQAQYELGNYKRENKEMTTHDKDKVIAAAKEVGAQQRIYKTSPGLDHFLLETEQLERFAQLVAAEYKRDAERYRWLREQDCVDWDQFQYADGFEFPDEVLDDEGAMVDAAIDAAIRARGDRK